MGRKNQIKQNKTNCMQRIKKILMWEILPAIGLKCIDLIQRFSTFESKKKGNDQESI